MRAWPFVVAAPAALGAVLAVQVAAAMSREYLPSEPGFVVDATVQPLDVTTATPLRMIVLGDSTAAGVGSPTVDEALPTLIAQRVAMQLGRPVTVKGLGISGSRTADVTKEQLPLIGSFDPDIVVVVIGSNDVTHVTPSWVLADDTRALLTAAQSSGAPVVLGGIPLFTIALFPQPLRWVVERIASTQRTVQERVAKGVDGVTYVPIAREASPRFAGVPDAMSDDGYHPGPVGYGFWADALAAGVVRALQQGAAATDPGATPR